MLSPSLTSHLLSTYYNLGTVLGPRDTTINKKLTFSGRQIIKTFTKNIQCVWWLKSYAKK